MKGNNGSGNNHSRDSWETKQELFDLLDKQYIFTYDCCATKENTKTPSFSSRFEEVEFVEGTAWMNPPFSKAKEMFEHFFKVIERGVAIYRCDNLEINIWQKIILRNCDWVFIFEGRVNYEGQNGNGARFPSALIGIGLEPPKDLKGTMLWVNKK
jgi:hypothetical protein